MATRYRFGDNRLPHFITFGVVNWIDVFSRECYKEIVVDSLKYCIEEKGLILHAWVIMTNHVHLIASAREGFELAATIRDFKNIPGKLLIINIAAQLIIVSGGLEYFILRCCSLLPGRVLILY